MSSTAHLSAVVKGRVQGVYYRAFAAREAKAMAIKGQVRNLRSGDVEIEAEGTRADLEEFLKRLRSGPSGAIVEEIDTKWSAATGNYASFDVRY